MQVEEYMAYRKLPRVTRQKISEYFEHRYQVKDVSKKIWIFWANISKNIWTLLQTISGEDISSKYYHEKYIPVLADPWSSRLSSFTIIIRQGKFFDEEAILGELSEKLKEVREIWNCTRVGRVELWKWELWKWKLKDVKVESCESGSWELWKWKLRVVKVKVGGFENESWGLLK